MIWSFQIIGRTLVPLYFDGLILVVYQHNDRLHVKESIHPIDIIVRKFDKKPC